MTSCGRSFCRNETIDLLLATTIADWATLPFEMLPNFVHLKSEI